MSKETIVFIGGLGTNKHIWEPQLALEDRYNIVRLELLGHGENNRDMPITIENMAIDILNQLEGKIKGKVHFVGNSLGGVVVQELWKHGRDLFKSMVLSNCPSKISPKLSFANMFNPMHRILSMNESLYYDVLEYQCLYNKSPEVKEMVRNGFTMRRDTYVRAALASSFMDMTKVLHTVDVPVLILTSDNDQVVDVEYMKSMFFDFKNAPYKDIKFIENSGHIPNIENVSYFNKTIHNFIAITNKL